VLDNRTVVYVMSGPAHLPYLVVSLMTLRRHWKGRIVVYAWPESYPVVKCMSKDERLLFEVRKWEPEYRKKNAQFECKQLVMASLPEETIGLYLDADTSVHESIDYLFHRINSETSFVATQFNKWLSTGKIPRNRVGRLKKFSEIDQDAVETMLVDPWPSLNGGVFVCRPGSPVLKKWYEWTKVARKIFISDETVLHVLQPIFGPSGEMTVVTGGKYNCSPMRFQPKDLLDEDVVIRHYHGDSNTRETKSSKGVGIWWKLYRKCMQKNIGGIQLWRAEVGNHYLDRLEQSIVRGKFNG